MRIDDFNYNIYKLQSRAKILSEYLSEMFFSDFEEFDSIMIEYEYQDSQALFFVCFNSISNEIIKNISNFYKFIGLNCDDWIIKIKNFNRIDESLAYVEFKSNEQIINCIINKIEVMKNKKNCVA